MRPRSLAGILGAAIGAATLSMLAAPMEIVIENDERTNRRFVNDLGLASDPHHQQAIRDRIDEFSTYQAAHPTKEPGITQHIVHNAPVSPPAEYVVPAGWKLVPVEPTEAMINEPYRFCVRHRGFADTNDPPSASDTAKAVWSAMLAASPPTTVQSGGWRTMESAKPPLDGTKIIFLNKFGWCSNVVHWRAPYEKAGITFPGRFETKDGQSTGSNDEIAWSHWTLAPLPLPPEGTR